MKVSDPRVLTEARLKALRHRERQELYRKQHGLTNQAIEAEKSKLWFDLITTLDGKNLSTLKRESQTQIRNLCARGIPVNVRGMVWPILIGWNDPSKNTIAREYEKSLREKADRLRRYIKRKSINDRDGYEDVHYALANGGDDLVAELKKDSATDAGGTTPMTTTTDIAADTDQSPNINFPAMKDVLNDNGESVEGKVDAKEVDSDQVQVEQGRGASSPASPDSTNEEKGEIMIDEEALDLDFTRFLEEQVALRGSKFTMSDDELSDDEEMVSTNTTGGLSGNSGNGVNDGKSTNDLPTGHVIDLANAFSYDQPTPPRAQLNRVASGDAESDLSIDYEQVMQECGAALIKRDLPRTFPTLKFFHDGGTLNEDLERVLYAYTIYSPAIGYVQGMSFIVAMLLLYLDETEAFTCLVQLMSKRGVNDFFSLERDSINTYVNIFNFFFQKNLPLLYKHLQEEGLSSEMFLMDWLLTMFVKPLHLDLAARVWDCYLAGDELIAMKLALGILRLYAPTLCTMEMVDARTYLTHLPQDLDFNRLWESVSHINVSLKTYEKVRAKFESKKQKEDKKKEALIQAAKRDGTASNGDEGKNSDTTGSLSSRTDRPRVSAKTGVSLKQDTTSCMIS